MALSTSVGVPGKFHQLRVLALHHEIHLGDVHRLLPPAQADRKLVVHLHDDCLRLLHHGAGGRVVQREVEVAVLVHRRGGQHAHVDVQRGAIVAGFVAVEKRDVVDQPLVAVPPVEPAEVPAHERERLALRVRFDDFQRPKREHPPDLDVLEFAFARRQRPIERMRDAVTERELDPIAGADGPDRFFGGAQLRAVLFRHIHRGAPPSRSIECGRHLSPDNYCIRGQDG